MATTEILHYPVSDSDNDSDSGKDELRHTDLEESIFKHIYNLSKIKSFLNSSRSGALSCMICLERIRLADPTWSCYKECYAVFHLICIQSWARQASDLSAARAASRLSTFPLAAVNAANWNCPKCRVEYSKTLIPSKYLCYCGKTQDPDSDPWILPHSCGEVCERPLKYECGHYCSLLFKNRCFCGKIEDVIRCGFKDFTCNRVCEKKLDWLCPPCKAKGVCKCQCGKFEQERECFEREFKCENECEKLLGCGKHVCEQGCHEGKCGVCPYQGKRSCPCGKRLYEGMPCDAMLPTCGSTCEKMLSCGIHRCPERFVPCHQALACERKCNRGRDCGRHACRRRCCDGDCPPCSEICDRKLRGNNHKCPSPCHRGACAPCPLMVTISCACGETRFESKGLLNVPNDAAYPLCRHAPKRKHHKCHYGACPPCRLVCEEEYPCGHSCKLRKPECTPGTPCPELVWRSCLEQHIGDQMHFQCQNLCGNLLGCTNHYCTKPCHALKSQNSIADRSVKTEPCEECHLPCEKERKLACPHPCPIPCHPGDCSPCKTLIKRSCHCGSMVHVFECTRYNSLPENEQLTIRSCGGHCHRKLPSCSHLCPEKCYFGQCPSPEKCSKKVNVRCRCQNLKKEWLCQDVQAAYITSGCDPKDISKSQFGIGLKVVDSGLQLRKSKVPEKILATVRWFFVCILVLVALVAASYYGYKGLQLDERG
ncbi:hypothetical protein MKX01_001960 [Papaver californicum]|nr:hypothetical protein MKX01_001960 [Papaver californicum]